MLLLLLVLCGAADAVVTVVGCRYYDTNQNGVLDTVRVDYSTSLASASVQSAWDAGEISFTVGGVNNYLSRTVVPTTAVPTNVSGSVSAATYYYVLDELPGAGTGGRTFQAIYSSAAQTMTAVSTSNKVSNYTQTCLDNAQPVLLGRAVTNNATGNSQLYVFRFSEPMENPSTFSYTNGADPEATTQTLTTVDSDGSDRELSFRLAAIPGSADVTVDAIVANVFAASGIDTTLVSNSLLTTVVQSTSNDASVASIRSVTTTTRKNVTTSGFVDYVDVVWANTASPFNQIDIVDSALPAAASFFVRYTVNTSVTYPVVAVSTGDFANDCAIRLFLGPGVLTTGFTVVARLANGSLTTYAGVSYGTSGVASSTGVDRAGPSITSAISTHGSSSILLTFTESVNGSLLTSSSFSFTGPRAVSYTVSAASGSSATLTANTTFTGAELSSFFILSADRSFRDSAAGNIGGFLATALSNTDSTPPTITVAYSADTDVSGTIDVVFVTFSDAVGSAGSTSNWHVSAGVTVSGVSLLAGGTVAQLNVTGASAGTNWTVTYTGTAIADLNLNLLANGSSVVTQPRDGNCVQSAFSYAGVCSRACGGGTRKMERVVVVAPFGNGTACGPADYYVPCNAAPCPFAACSDTESAYECVCLPTYEGDGYNCTATNLTDTDPPVVFGGAALDLDQNGRIDAVVLALSEAVVCLNGTERSFIVGGRVATSADCDGLSILLGFPEDPTKNTAATPFVEYLGGGFVADSAGNELVV